MGKMNKRVGIYGGTFDPVHIGHVALVVSLAEAHLLDHVYILPTSKNPHKKRAPFSKASHRLKMLKKAFLGLPYCQVLSIEMRKSNPSYMIDTIHELREKSIVQDNDTLFLLMGEDLLKDFDRWRKPEELIAIAKPLIASRQGASFVCSPDWSPALKKAIENGLTKTPLFDISATKIRQRLAKGQFCGHLLDSSVLKYIKKHSLYNA